MALDKSDSAMFRTTSVIGGIDCAAAAPLRAPMVAPFMLAIASTAGETMAPTIGIDPQAWRAASAARAPPAAAPAAAPAPVTASGPTALAAALVIPIAISEDCRCTTCTTDSSPAPPGPGGPLDWEALALPNVSGQCASVSSACSFGKGAWPPPTGMRSERGVPRGVWTSIKSLSLLLTSFIFTLLAN